MYNDIYSGTCIKRLPLGQGNVTVIERRPSHEKVAICRECASQSKSVCYVYRVM